MYYLRTIAVCLAVFLFTSILIVEPAVLYSAEKKPAPVADLKDDGQDEDEKAADVSEERNPPKPAPGQWEALFELGDSIYPSLIVSTATIKVGLWDDNDKNHLGDRWGIIGIAVKGTKDNCPIEVEISGINFIKPSVFTGTLPDKDTVYCVYPTIKYDYAKLLAVKQTVPETVSFKVRIDGKDSPAKDVRLQVRPINECPYSFVDSDGNANDISYFLAAYVNENHPYIDQILKEALQTDKIDSFVGYSDDEDNKEAVMAQIKAIWAALQARGIRYSDISSASSEESPYLESQSVRLLSESINYAQANCVDGSVLMASIFRRIGLNPSLIVVPGHMFLGVSLDQEGKGNIHIETTDLGQTTFEEALEDGEEAFSKGRGKFDSDKEEYQEYKIINIMDARGMGIMPIRDSSAKKIANKGNHPTVIEEDDDDSGE